MVSRLVYAAAIAALTLGGCASTGYYDGGGGYNGGDSGSYDGGYYGGGDSGGYDGGYYGGGYSGGYDGGYYAPYPGETYSYNPYYGGPSYYGDGAYYGGGAFFDFEDEFHHRHFNDDRKDSDNRSDRFFNPGHGVTCDRRTRTCFDDGHADRGLTEKFFGEHSSGAPRPRGVPDDQRNAFNAQSDRHLNRPAQPDGEFPILPRGNAQQRNHRNVIQPIPVPQQQMQGMVDNRKNAPARPRPNAQPGPPIFQNGSGACPPRGCPNK